jgi:hypothetical protein
MGRCIYCGQSAGWFRKVHEVCEERRRAGYRDMVTLATESAKTGTNLDGLSEKLEAMARQNFVEAYRVQKALAEGWENALDNALEDNVLSLEEENWLMAFAKRFELTQEDLNHNGAYSRATMNRTLREILEGKVPTNVKIEGNLPFNIQSSESLIWMFQDVNCLEERTHRHYEGGSQGVSIRVMKGVYYRVGAFKGYPVETTHNEVVDQGIFGITTQNLYFVGSRKSFRIPYKKVVSFTPYSDGIGICQEGKKAQQFVTGDGWFVYNAVVNLARRGGG